MLKNFDDIQKVGKDNMDTAMKSFGSVSKGLQAIASEVVSDVRDAMGVGPVRGDA